MSAPVVVAGVLSGCAMSDGAGDVPGTSAASKTVSGAVHGGQAPVVGATISLMVPATTYGGTPTVLASTTTAAGGNFNLPGYTCPANSGLMYVTATGGSAGSGTNSVLAEAAMLGPCSALTPATFVVISEATTVAAAYTLAPFATVSAGGTGIGAPVSNQQGLMNAYGAANNLVNVQNGAARGVSDLTGAVLPQAEVNTLANILASCVNTNGATGYGTTCGSLFGAATPPGGVAPLDTFQAALNIALNPGTNVGTLFGLSTANAPFQPAMPTAPADFALGIQYNAGGLNGSYGTQGVAIDSVGNAWVAAGNEAGNVGYVHTLVEISPGGAYLSGTTGYGTMALSSPEGVAIDASGNVYVTDLYGNSVVKFASNGAVLGTLTGAVPNGPLGIAVDTDGSLWVVGGAANQIAHLTTAGANIGRSPYSTLSTTTDIVLNSTQNWTDEYQYGSSNFGVLTNFVTGSPAIGETVYALSAHPAGIALDAAGDCWYGADSDSGGGIIGRFTSRGIATNPFLTVADPLKPQGMFIDGLGNIWVATYNDGSATAPGALLEYSSVGAIISPTTGYGANGTLPPSPGFPGAMAVDRSGNLWLAGNTPVPSSPSGGTQAAGYVTELIGIAAPVVTPITVAATNNALGARP
jgi:sugar lactone lactonase YvrE